MQRLDAAKREAILNAAKQRLYKYGIQKTTMQEIAKDAGIAVGTLYLYFKNKNEILIATAQAYAQKHLADTEVILKSQISPSEKLKAYLINRFRSVQESRLGGSHAAEVARTVIRLNPQLQEEQGHWVRNNVLKILQEGIEANFFQSDDLEQDVEVFLYSIGYFFPLATTEKYYEPEEEKLCMVVDWFLKQWCCK
ncbi:TetR/AcrR family transcriptional regulator [Brasilonema sp. UFV-L1]|uniref:TetR/AcrR family transcriptional regulator n=1 Tax=Brasilonema sp. UFV-L1 TaxID=2234130 RepID=UPI00145CF27F|nr:TetR/AcrR family transcriptional regulator [Brasilonema sp. UFV-L1]NMG10509.1 TetR/AcrR family transcriptional regulator [Brasilonema sp. UFV-L1]